MKNVFHLCLRPRYYWRHPIKFIKEIFRNISDAWRRATRGWTYSDVWNFNCWFLEIVPDMLDYLAEHGCGYPGDEEFPTYESWQEWLRKQAAAIRSCREEEQDKRNEYREEYYAALDRIHLTSEPDKDNPKLRIMKFENEPENMEDLTLKYNKRASEIAQEAEETLNEAMSELARLMPTLWD